MEFITKEEIEKNGFDFYIWRMHIIEYKSSLCSYNKEPFFWASENMHHNILQQKEWPIITKLCPHNFTICSFLFLGQDKFFFLIIQWTLLRFFAFSVLWFQDVRIIYLVESSYKNCINWLFIIQHVYLVNWQRNSPWRWWSRIKLTVNIIVRTTHTQCVHFALGSFLLLISSHFLIDIV